MGRFFIYQTIINTILIVCIILLIIALIRIFRKYPYTYGNVVITGVVIFLTAFIVGSYTIRFIEERDGSLSPVWTAASFLWQFTRGLLIPICFMCLFLCISNVVLLKREGFRLHNLLGFIFSGIYLSVVNILWEPTGSLPPVMTRAVVFFRLIFCYMECTILAICIVSFAAVRRKPRYDRDFIIILGCSVSRKGKMRPLLKGRVNRAMRFVWEQEWETAKSSIYIPSGGQGIDEPISEGSAMELYLLSHGAEECEVIAEKKSRNTEENILFSKRIIDGKQENARIAIVTTNFHVLRSGMIAHRLGLDADVIASGTKWYFWPNALAREIVAILMMYKKVHVAVAILCAAAVALLYNA